RTPLREALRRLEEEGLVVTQHNRRARVADFDADDLEVVYATRIGIEALGAFLTVPLIADSELSELEACLQGMRSTAPDYAAWEVPHRRFHELLTIHSSEGLGKTLQTYRQRSECYRREWLSKDVSAWGIGDGEHEAVLRAFEARDAGLGAKLLAQHLGRAAL